MANPPIVIGPFDNVPAPGSPIRSAWPQEITQYVVDAFVQAGVGNYTADASGNLSITFPITYRPGTTPVLVVCGAWEGYQEVLYTVAAGTLTAGGGLVRAFNTNTGAPQAGSLSVSWIAFGKR